MQVCGNLELRLADGASMDDFQMLDIIVSCILIKQSQATKLSNEFVGQPFGDTDIPSGYIKR
jgi:hypothetical protein